MSEKKVVKIEDEGFKEPNEYIPIGWYTITYSDITTERKRGTILDCAKLKLENGFMSNQEYQLLSMKTIPPPSYGD